VNGREVKIGVRIGTAQVHTGLALSLLPMRHHPPRPRTQNQLSATVMCSVTCAAIATHAHTMHGTLQQSSNQ
jgi:hypothetical protein